MDIQSVFAQLEKINNKLHRLKQLDVLPHQDSKYALEYDLFMEFIGLYEDAKNYIQQMPDELLDKKRYEIRLKQLWSDNEEKTGTIT